VTLSWGASSSTVAGYNLYRSTVNGGSYSKVNASLLATLNYADSSVTGGTTYYYVATAVDSSGTESVYSNQVTATVP
jgi:fibronectin type 3 domain-containing protein